MITKNKHFYHEYLHNGFRKQDPISELFRYFRIGNYRFIIRGDSKKNTFYDI